MTELALTCDCGSRVAGNVAGGSTTVVCPTCGLLWLLSCGTIGRAGDAELVLGAVFLHGRGVAHVDAGDGRSACGLELADVQLVLAGGRRCKWCDLTLAEAAA